MANSGSLLAGRFPRLACVTYWTGRPLIHLAELVGPRALGMLWRLVLQRPRWGGELALLLTLGGLASAIGLVVLSAHRTSDLPGVPVLMLLASGTYVLKQLLGLGGAMTPTAATLRVPRTRRLRDPRAGDPDAGLVEWTGLAVMGIVVLGWAEASSARIPACSRLYGPGSQPSQRLACVNADGFGHLVRVAETAAPWLLVGLAVLYVLGTWGLRGEYQETVARLRGGEWRALGHLEELADRAAARGATAGRTGAAARAWTIAPVLQGLPPGRAAGHQQWVLEGLLRSAERERRLLGLALAAARGPAPPAQGW